MSFKIWKPGGLVAHASDPALIGQRFEPKPELEAAWSGKVTGSFDDLDDAENAAEAAIGVPLLEVYSPLHEVWSGRIIAVAEFYEVAAELEQDLADARRTSWLLVAGTFLASGLMLLGIVRAGCRTIARQKAMLEAQIGESRDVAAQNVELRRRAIDASARATAQAERSLRRVSADLHDGPAQYVALAAMRLDSLVPATEAGRREATALGEALQTALGEIRALSRGLSLPDLDRLSLAEVARRAVAAHLRPAGPPVELDLPRPGGPGGRRKLADLPLPLPAGGALERLAPRGRGGRRRRGRGRRRPADRDGDRSRGRGSTPPRSEPCPAAAGWVSRASGTAPRASAASSASTAPPAAARG